METAKLTVRLPKRDLEFAKRYAQEHRITVTELIIRSLKRLQGEPQVWIHPEVEKILGVIPAEVDAAAEYHEHMLRKHQ
jgi:Family of unknown function (DUF6364)